MAFVTPDIFLSKLANDFICIKNENDDFYEFVEKKLKGEYINELNIFFNAISYPSLQNEIKEVERNIDGIISIVKSYEQGKISIATTEFEKIISKYLSLLENKKIPIDKDTVFYRSRKIETNDIQNRDELFHLPFYKKRKSGNYRFSISGYPCLYVSNCSFLNWIELDKPDLSKIACSKLEYTANDPGLIFDFSLDIFNSTNIHKEISISSTIIEKYIQLIPLYFILFCRTKESAQPFEPEYIFPQLLTDYVKNKYAFSKDIIGFKYPSTKLNDKEFKFYNFIFFTNQVSIKATAKLKYCEFLSDNFMISNGIPFNYCNTFGNAKNTLKKDYKSVKIKVSENYFTDYKKSIFYKMEILLDHFKVEKINCILT